MPINNIPDLYLNNPSLRPDLFVYDFKMTEETIKAKVNLKMHMFSFLQTGKKQVHFSNDAVLVDNKHSLLIKKGNCLWSELLDTEDTYYCKLLFFSEHRLHEFLKKHVKDKEPHQETPLYFAIENDTYLTSYLNSLATIITAPPTFMDDLLSVKFDELMLYLINKYKSDFESYLLSLITKEESSFKNNIEENTYSTLTLEEIAFLCNMSLSTFKRHFIKTYNVSPGKWLRDKRLLKAKELLEKGEFISSDIYLDLGYNNLSNFSTAFKNKFGMNPSEV
ncbi:AraC-like DNA-binding protein [Tenacibaculum adriaticum]|uniref:AraC-like DNA-binding protein n=1 Tax=Tenacibaculum adriaticum TaxID=413713 RepID=A0A5S5DVC7_9FLAO|nr:AraC family transcriptional regulator [Tenacibaculum adriaticum]TYP99228.1 AraC-like DNA-binding protein [Tenacibaculum adriaticum]